jgi:ABC-type transport system substrate-binding protein
MNTGDDKMTSILNSARPHPGHFRTGPARLAATVVALALAATAAASPKTGGTIAVGLAQDPAIVDPIRTGTFTERQLSTPVYESLFDIDPKGQAVPFLAEATPFPTT